MMEGNPYVGHGWVRLTPGEQMVRMEADCAAIVTAEPYWVWLERNGEQITQANGPYASLEAAQKYAERELSRHAGRD